MDTSVKPGDDFYAFANGTWAKNTQIPADKSNWGSFAVLQDLSQQRTRDLLDAAKDDPNSKIGAAYSSFLDEAAVEAKGLAPIQPWLNEFADSRAAAAMRRFLPRRRATGSPACSEDSSGQDDRNSDVYIVELGQAGLGMPDRDMYLLNEPNFVSLRAGYLDHLTKMLTLAGENNAAARAKSILDIRDRDRKSFVEPRRQQRRDQDL